MVTVTQMGQLAVYLDDSLAKTVETACPMVVYNPSPGLQNSQFNRVF